MKSNITVVSDIEEASSQILQDILCLFTHLFHSLQDPKTLSTVTQKSSHLYIEASPIKKKKVSNLCGRIQTVLRLPGHKGHLSAT